MKTDAQIKHDVMTELEWDPAIEATHVGVAVNGGVVTLSGHLDTLAEKRAVERAVQRVAGVTALANELEVKQGPAHRHCDADIAEAAHSALAWRAELPPERLRVQVEHGWVTLSGEVDWDYQRGVAEKAVHHLSGVVGVTNRIVLKQRPVPDDIAQRIRDALARHARREADRIEVQVDGSTVTLQGQVGSWSECVAAQGAAWSAPGITQVVNQLAVKDRRS